MKEEPVALVYDYYGPQGKDTMACLKQSGAVGIARYLTASETDPRQITPQEVADAHALGLAVHFFFEEQPPNAPASWFTFARGMEDAGNAIARLNWLGAPDRTIVWFAVDANILPSLLDEYFNGVESIASTEAAYATERIIPGVYGYQRMVEYARLHYPNIGKHLAQTYGTVTGPLDLWQHEQQDQCGIAVDLNDCWVEGWKGVAMSAPSFAGQSTVEMQLVVGEVKTAWAAYHYPSGNRNLPFKVIGRTPGVQVVYFYPPAAPDADPTLEISARPAVFVVVTRPAL